MSDRRKEAEEKMAKAIFISADCWLCVFDLLPADQLGFGISMISHRFDFYVSEHFKTRKWTLKHIQIERTIGKNGTNEMEIVNSHGKPMPIAQIQLPRKVSGFRRIIIYFIDQNVITFLHRFRPIFDSFCPINLAIYTYNDRILEFILHNIWPMIGEKIHGLRLSATFFHRLRKFVPSIFIDCSSLRVVFFDFGDFFTEFPADDSAAASDGQAVAKWLFTARPDNVPKVLFFSLHVDNVNWPLNIEPFKAAFANASSPVNFIISIWFPPPFADSVLLFDLTNELTGEQLAFKRTNKSDRFLLIRCAIARDESKWTKWEKEAIGWQTYDQWNKIGIHIYNEDEFGKGLLDATPGPSDQQQK
ncbi:hypothetical protein niasHT_005510 [Heterodera trifolii]|uniref:F-box associated domain-containing protein n=1 Tax=Heterodera trifolii TaxID=157864 RepID=A0ABD2LSU3_9BILA